MTFSKLGIDDFIRIIYFFCCNRCKNIFFITKMQRTIDFNFFLCIISLNKGERIYGIKISKNEFRLY